MRALLTALIVACMAAAALAGEISPKKTTDDDIVVTGKREDKLPSSVITREARNVSRLVSLYHEPLARIDNRVCPGVIGLKREAAEIMVGMIRERAELFGIPLAKENKCTPNILVLFSSDGRAALAELERKYRSISAVLSLKETHELTRDEGPTRVFSIVETRMLNGMPVGRSNDLMKPPVGTVEGGHSRITLVTQQDIIASLVVFDRQATIGKTLNQLADYTVMRAFARTRDVDKGQSLDTILELFAEDGPKPVGLTPFDRAYLAALYEGVPYIPAQAKLRRIDDKLAEGAGMQQGR